MNMNIIICRLLPPTKQQILMVLFKDKGDSIAVERGGQITVSIISYKQIYYPWSKQFRDPPTYTHQPSMQQKVPFSLIRCSSSKVAFCSCVCEVRLAHI